MTTQIFENYEDFLNREDKTVNGVSPEFAALHPDFEEDNKTNEGCWNCRRCSYCSDCADCSSCSECNSCSDCSYCADCSSCSECNSCSDCSEEKVNIPSIENIHQKVYAAASFENALEMGSWHTCETTHCRAGWVVHLAGKEGYELERIFDTCLAAQLIYRESGYEINPNRFFDSNKDSLADMKRLAEMEKCK